jgi:hypothetical protein
MAELDVLLHLNRGGGATAMPLRSAAITAVLALAVTLLDGAATAALGQTGKESPESLIPRSKVWHPVETAALNLKTGPDGPGAFAPRETVACDYFDKKLSGNTPKFACRLPNGDELKVKYLDANNKNGEVYGEILGSRLLWALGFGADRMYSVRIVCHGCPATVGGIVREDGDRILDPAAVERKLGRELADRWSWAELDKISEANGGATRAERDALKLLAVFMQHSDSKPVQQRIVCLDGASDKKQRCAEPLMMISDVGISFGRALARNQEPRVSVNLTEWSELRVWKDEKTCVGNLSGSWTGTLKYPEISEAGRRLLADMLMKLSDDQLRDMFEAAHVDLRPRSPQEGRSGFPTVDEWVTAFKDKRRQIVDHRCTTSPRAVP